MPTKTRQQRRARARSPLRRRRRGAVGFLVFILLILFGGGYLVTLFRTNPPPVTRGAAIGEHWHASYRIYICGRRLANFPTVEGELHSHGDGFIHIHPATPQYAGPGANLGAFLRLYETGIGVLSNGKRTIVFPDGTAYKDGDRCPGSKKRYNVVVTNKGKAIKGDPAAYTPHDGDAIVIQFGRRGEKILPNPYAKAKNLPTSTAAPSEQRAPD